jgi:hypothetical protein
MMTICMTICLSYGGALQGDMEAMALMALELGNTLNERSLECALASALSVIGPNGGAPGV